MKLLFLGDIVGRAGREAVVRHLPTLRTTLQPDIVIANAENAAAGFGITRAIADELLKLGIDCLTTGNHVWDQRELLGQIDQLPRLLRPLNYPAGTPGRGHALIALPDKRQVLVINLMGRLFMDALDDPFAAIESLLGQYRLGNNLAGIFVDFHAEASSEKMALGHFLDGRVSAVVGTHTHVPTADAMLLPRGTAYQTDSGMCGDYHSVIGMKKEVPVARFTRKLPTDRLSPAEGEATLCGVYVEIHDATGLAQTIKPVRVGGKLTPT
jgi:2',3'-cyclic-nucleotide 2'-phosphodiesterase